MVEKTHSALPLKTNVFNGNLPLTEHHLDISKQMLYQPSHLQYGPVHFNVTPLAPLRRVSPQKA